MVITILVLGIIFIWLGFVTYLLLKTIGNFNKLTKGTTDKTLSEVLRTFLDEEKLTQEQLKKVGEALKQQQHDAKVYLQKLGFVRFNPFADTGGDQSFSLALLDADDNGVVITSLYARTGVRWYIKTITKGRGVEHELSKEEAEAVKKATRKH